jgi:phosphatidate cytidylyltransferase
MTNLQKRILTSLIILPLSFFFIIKGGHLLFFFLVTVFCLANYELFSCFKKVYTILIINLILILSLFSIYYLSNQNLASFLLLLWVIILTVFSDIGGYIFGKIFKWKKLTKISPKKTLSGVFGSFLFSFISNLITSYFLFTGTNINLLGGRFNIYPDEIPNLLEVKFLFLAIVLSLIAQIGDLTISFFKRIEKIKDAGSILPGHGGIFDRIDSLMLVLIFTFIIYHLNII